VPIVYPIKLLKDKIGDVSCDVIMAASKVIEYNPLTILIEQTRKVFVFGQNPDWIYLLFVYFISGLVLQLGYFWFIRTRKGFSDVV
jgi:ABC-type polysaccharide/polyol phosphate export permease